MRRNFLKGYLMTSYVFKRSFLGISGPKSSSIGVWNPKNHLRATFGTVETDLRVVWSFRLLWRTTFFRGILANTIKTSQRCVENFLKPFLMTSYVFKRSFLGVSGPKSWKFGVWNPKNHLIATFGAVETDLRVGSSFRLLWRTTFFLGILANTIKTSQRCVENFLKPFLMTSYVFKRSFLEVSGRNLGNLESETQKFTW